MSKSSNWNFLTIIRSVHKTHRSPNFLPSFTYFMTLISLWNISVQHFHQTCFCANAQKPDIDQHSLCQYIEFWTRHTLIAPLIIKIDHFPNLCCKNKLSCRVNIYLFSLFEHVPEFSAQKTTNLLGFSVRPLLTRKLLSRGLFLSRVQCVGWSLSTQQWVILCREQLTEKVSPGNFQFWASENNNLLLALSIQIVAGF